MHEVEKTKTLVAYYSREGHTARMAKEIARRCQSDLEVIEEKHEAGAMLGGLRRLWQTMSRASPPIRRPRRSPARYDLVIIGSPVGSFGIAPPVRSYVRQYASAFRNVAFFCAEGGTHDEAAFAELSRLCRREPVATFAVKRKHLPPAANLEGMTVFMNDIQRP